MAGTAFKKGNVGLPETFLLQGESGYKEGEKKCTSDGDNDGSHQGSFHVTNFHDSLVITHCGVSSLGRLASGLLSACVTVSGDSRVRVSTDSLSSLICWPLPAA